MLVLRPTIKWDPRNYRVVGSAALTWSFEPLQEPKQKKPLLISSASSVRARTAPGSGRRGQKPIHGTDEVSGREAQRTGIPKEDGSRGHNIIPT